MNSNRFQSAILWSAHVFVCVGPVREVAAEEGTFCPLLGFLFCNAYEHTQTPIVGKSIRGSDPHIRQSLGDLGQSTGQLWVFEFESIDPVGESFRDT